MQKSAMGRNKEGSTHLYSPSAATLSSSISPWTTERASAADDKKTSWALASSLRFLIGSGCNQLSNDERAWEATYVLQNSFHECDSNFSFLYQIVLRILDLETGLFLFSRVAILKSKKKVSYRYIDKVKGKRTYDCFAASNSNLLTLTACLAFIATPMEAFKVVCHGCKKLS